MYDVLRTILKSDDFSVVESFETPGQLARYAAIPQFLFDSRIGLHLDRRFRQQSTRKGALWAHQAQALEALGRGDNVVISTGTASGKSLVFQSLAFHKVLLDSDSRLLIFYPLKALAADQLRGWRETAHSLELDENVIGRIDGSVPFKDREDILQKSTYHCNDTRRVPCVVDVPLITTGGKGFCAITINTGDGRSPYT